VAKPEPPSKSQRLLLIARRCWCQDCVRGPGTLRANGGWKKLNAGGCSRVMFAALIESRAASRILVFTALAALLFAPALSAHAIEIGFTPTPIARKILELYDSKSESNPTETRLHQLR
jgi:hypothetical protein